VSVAEPRPSGSAVPQAAKHPSGCGVQLRESSHANLIVKLGLGVELFRLRLKESMGLPMRNRGPRTTANSGNPGVAGLRLFERIR
jgi:hypothetical protein